MIDLNLTIPVLDHGSVTLRNLAGPTRRPQARFDADSVDPARTARISFDAEAESRPRDLDLKLNKFLLKHHHNTPIEMIEVWLEMKLPIFVARQYVRHRTATINEVSGRYVTLPANWYIPTPESVGFVTDSIKQGREIRLGEVNPAAEAFCASLDHACRNSYQAYLFAIEDSIPNEVARNLLHLNHYTHWVWKQDLWNMLSLLGKRLAPGAQYEARVYAAAIQTLLIREIPELMAAAELYRDEN